ncbi:MAG: hypothetical protein P1V20_07825 [Verrucomicrobiales bacterium]|nr:hypothetical protein [Verrucomicrobiales bacterium]
MAGKFIVGRVLLSVAICAQFGCSTCEMPLTSGGKSSAFNAVDSGRHVDIFRGLGGYMKGREQLQARLAECGISSTTWLSADAKQVAKRIPQRRSRGDLSPVVLMGYATGGSGTRQVATILKQHDIEVDTVILIDPSFFEPVPCNVRHCFVAYRPEIWQKWNSIMRGNPVITESDRTKITKINLTEKDFEGALSDDSHLAITSDPWVQSILVSEAVKATASSR